MRVAVVAGLAVTLAGTVAVLRIWQQGGSDEQRPSDAIVVLGAAQYDGRPSPVFEARLEHAVALYRAGIAPRFVVTGGKLPGDRTTEAAVAREYAIAHGVPASAVFGEDQAHNTLDSLRTVAGELDERGLRSAVFVSDPTHMYRVLRIASDLGLEAYGSPTRTSPVDADLGRRIEATAHELGALALYFVTGGTAPVEQPGG
ncbi:MAG TPA: YdcF family protein [Candidatus Limnocylindrales bacterium]